MLPAHSLSPDAEASPDLHAYTAGSESSWEHPELGGPLTHLQHPVDMENF